MKSYRNKVLRVSVFLIVIAMGLYTFYLYQQGSRSSEAVSEAFFMNLDECLVLESEEKKMKCLATLCEYEPGYLCAEDIVYEVTGLKGPEEGMQILRDISVSQEFVLGGDLHQLAHIVGRSAAENHGGTGEVFNRCPLDFDYGCLHGFFESAMLRFDAPVLALVDICDSYGDDFYDKGDCFHGAGHGLMMHENYDLKKAVSVCAGLSTYQSACWSGVFMENAMGFVAGRVSSKNSVFEPDRNWLAPCDSLGQEYRHACYSYHHRIYLPHRYSAHLDDLIDVCLGAGEDAEVCFVTLAEAFTAIAGDTISQQSFPDVAGDRVQRAAYLCDRFPEEYISLCHTSALDRIVRVDRDDTLEGATRYCGAITKHRSVCDGLLGTEVTPRSIVEQVAAMSLEEKIGQMFMYGIPVHEPVSEYLLDKLKDLTQVYHIGGIILSGSNIMDRDRVVSLVEQAQAWSDVPLFVSLDQEGVFLRLDFLNEATPQYRIKTAEQAKQVAVERGRELREVGVTMNFHPVLEYVSHPTSFMYDRSFQSDPETNAVLGGAMVEGYWQGGIIPVIKHFPGHGNSPQDSHLYRVVLSWSPEDIDTYLHPFREVIKKYPTVPVMIAHVTIPSMDSEMASCSSVFLSEILRGQLGHEGVIIIDALDMEICGTQEEAAIKAINAGADIVFPVGWPGPLPKYLKQAVLNGDISEARIDESVKRILLLKSKM